MPTDGSDHRRRLAELMDDRRIELDLSWEEVARRAGISGMTLRRIRNDESEIPRRTAAKIDRALKWQPGSVEGILTGGDPAPIRPDELQPLTEEQRQLKDVYEFYVRKYGRAEALARISRDVDEINAARERRSRAAG